MEEASSLLVTFCGHFSHQAELYRLCRASSHWRAFAFAGCKDEKMSILLKEVFQTPYFRISYVKDEETVELCGALKVSD